MNAPERPAAAHSDESADGAETLDEENVAERANASQGEEDHDDDNGRADDSAEVFIHGPIQMPYVLTTKGMPGRKRFRPYTPKATAAGTPAAKAAPALAAARLVSRAPPPTPEAAKLLATKRDLMARRSELQEHVRRLKLAARCADTVRTRYRHGAVPRLPVRGEGGEREESRQRALRAFLRGSRRCLLRPLPPHTYHARARTRAPQAVLDKLEGLVDKWRAVVQQAATELQAQTAETAAPATVADVLAAFNIDHDLVRFVPETDGFQ